MKRKKKNPPHRFSKHDQNSFDPIKCTSKFFHLQDSKVHFKTISGSFRAYFIKEYFFNFLVLPPILRLKDHGTLDFVPLFSYFYENLTSGNIVRDQEEMKTKCISRSAVCFLSLRFPNSLVWTDKRQTCVFELCSFSSKCFLAICDRVQCLIFLKAEDKWSIELNAFSCFFLTRCLRDCISRPGQKHGRHRSFKEDAFQSHRRRRPHGHS